MFQLIHDEPLLSAKDEIIPLYQLSQAKELEEHLQQQRFIMYELKHTSKLVHYKVQKLPIFEFLHQKKIPVTKRLPIHLKHTILA